MSIPKSGVFLTLPGTYSIGVKMILKVESTPMETTDIGKIHQRIEMKNGKQNCFKPVFRVSHKSKVCIWLW